MRYGFFPGCSLVGSARDYYDSARRVFSELGADLVELEDWNCCGTTAAVSVDMELSLALPARNLALASAQGFDELVVGCNACYVTLNRCRKILETAEPARKKLGTALSRVGLSLEQVPRVVHLAEVLVRYIGIDAFAGRIVNPLVGLRVAPYYGCQFSRPKNDFADPEMPDNLDDFMRATGATIVNFEQRSRCCGGSLSLTHLELVLTMCRRLLGEAEDVGANVLMVACPMCQLNLDAYQHKVNREFGTNFNLPVMYFTQLAGWAMGIKPRHLGLQKLFIQPHLPASVR